MWVKDFNQDSFEGFPPSKYEVLEVIICLIRRLCWMQKCGRVISYRNILEHSSFLVQIHQIRFKINHTKPKRGFKIRKFSMKNQLRKKRLAGVGS